MSDWSTDLATWMDLHAATGIPIKEVRLSPSLVAREIPLLFDAWERELRRPYSGQADRVNDQLHWLETLQRGHATRCAYVFGVRAALGPIDQDVPFHIVPCRDPLIFGASA
jgi:hypothetical protein